ncbi:MAG: MMPL family transporter, partial [Actinomycetota bacterium]
MRDEWDGVVMGALARFTTGSAKLIVVVAAVLVVGGGAWAGGVTERLTTGGNDVPGSDSVQAAELLDERGGVGTPNLVVMITTDDLDGEAAVEVTERLANAIESDGGELVGDHLGPDGDALRSADERSGLVVAHLPGDDEAVQQQSARLAPILRDLAESGVEVAVGGTGPARAELITQTEEDLLRAELIAVPITFLLLLLVFRTAVAALLPLVVAVSAIAGTLIALRLLVEVTTVSVFAQNVMTALGLAMAIDFTLFLVSRYRELRPASPSSTDAVGGAVRAAGPSILFSGLTTAASLAGLLAFDTPMLRSFAYAGVAVVLVAIIGALVVLPAVMTLLGDRLDRWAVRKVAPRADLTTGRWYRLAHLVMRRPGVVALVTIAGLLLVAAPFTRIEFG